MILNVLTFLACNARVHLCVCVWERKREFSYLLANTNPGTSKSASWKTRRSRCCTRLGTKSCPNSAIFPAICYSIGWFRVNLQETIRFDGTNNGFPQLVLQIIPLIICLLKIRRNRFCPIYGWFSSHLIPSFVAGFFWANYNNLMATAL